jgi:hypothetical protein
MLARRAERAIFGQIARRRFFKNLRQTCSASGGAKCALAIHQLSATTDSSTRRGQRCVVGRVVRVSTLSIRKARGCSGVRPWCLAAIASHRRYRLRPMAWCTRSGTGTYARWELPIADSTAVSVDFVGNDGKVWTFEVGSNLPIGAAIDTHGHVFLEDEKNTVYLLDTCLDYAASAWPKALHGNRRHTQKADCE